MPKQNRLKRLLLAIIFSLNEYLWIKITSPQGWALYLYDIIFEQAKK